MKQIYINCSGFVVREADMAAGPGWWAGEGAQVVTIVRCDA